MILKANTQYIRQFLMILASDHVSPATGKTVTIKLGKAGAAGTGTTNSPAEVDAVNMPGVYKIQLSDTDTNTLGDLWFHCTASGCDNTDFVDTVEQSIFPDLVLDVNGNASVASNVKKNTALNGFMFVMTVNGVPTASLTVTAQRSLNGAGFAPCANAVTEVGVGVYSINLAAADLNANTVMFRFTATGADDRDIFLVTQP